MSDTPRKDRTWLIASCVFLLAMWLGVISYSREIAQWKIQLSHRIYNPGLKTDIAALIVSNLEYFRLFTLYNALLIGLVPLLIGRIRRLWLGMLILLILALPSFWYGFQTTYLVGKLIDWRNLASL